MLFIIEIKGYIPVVIHADNMVDAMVRMERNIYPGIFSPNNTEIGEVIIKRAETVPPKEEGVSYSELHGG